MTEPGQLINGTYVADLQVMPRLARSIDLSHYYHGTLILYDDLGGFHLTGVCKVASKTVWTRWFDADLIKDIQVDVVFEVTGRAIPTKPLNPEADTLGPRAVIGTFQGFDRHGIPFVLRGVGWRAVEPIALAGNFAMKADLRAVEIDVNQQCAYVRYRDE